MIFMMIIKKRCLPNKKEIKRNCRSMSSVGNRFSKKSELWFYGEQWVCLIIVTFFQSCKNSFFEY